MAWIKYYCNINGVATSCDLVLVSFCTCSELEQVVRCDVTSRDCRDWSTVLPLYVSSSIGACRWRCCSCECPPSCRAEVWYSLYVLAFQSLCYISNDRCIVWINFLHTSAVETWVRNSVGEEHLTGSAMMNIHRDIHLDVNDVIDRFASKKRKIPFALYMYRVGQIKQGQLTFLLVPERIYTMKWFLAGINYIEQQVTWCQWKRNTLRTRRHVWQAYLYSGNQKIQHALF